MSFRSKVVWSEGLFLRPQHFQQQDRYLEGLIEARSAGLRPYAWGFQDVQVDQDLLAVGKLAIQRARGVFPDGTPFAMPDEDELPAPIDIDENCRDQVAYLCTPVRRPGANEVEADQHSLARFGVDEVEVTDATEYTEQTAPMQIGRLRTRLLLGSEDRSDYQSLGFAHVVEARADKGAMLQADFMPSCLDIRAAPRLAGFLNELRGMLDQHAEALAARLAASGTGGVAGIVDFLKLQAYNRYLPLIRHLSVLPNLHPEEVYRHFVVMSGEFSTLASSGGRAPEFEEYRHDQLRESFAPVIASLRGAFAAPDTGNVVAIPLEEKRFGIHVGIMPDTSLVGSANFVFAVKADLPVEDVRSNVPRQVKIGPVEKIRDLVNLALPGITLNSMPVAPRQIPYHAGFCYFELDPSSEFWSAIQNSGGVAIHVGGEFPGLAMEFWAIRAG